MQFLIIFLLQSRCPSNKRIQSLTTSVLTDIRGDMMLAFKIEELTWKVFLKDKINRAKIRKIYNESIEHEKSQLFVNSHV